MESKAVQDLNSIVTCAREHLPDELEANRQPDSYINVTVTKRSQQKNSGVAILTRSCLPGSCQCAARLLYGSQTVIDMQAWGEVPDSSGVLKSVILNPDHFGPECYFERQPLFTIIEQRLDVLMSSSEPSTDIVVERTLIQSSATAFPTNPRTLADVREEVAQSLALRMITKARTIDGVRIGVHFTFSKKDDGRFLRLVTSHIRARLPSSRYLFAIATTGASPTSRGTRGGTRTSNALVICGSDEDDVQRAVLLASSKFLGRVDAVQNTGTLLAASVRHIGSSYDDAALWDVLSKSVRTPIDPLLPPPGSRSIDQLLSDARSKLERMTPRQAYDALHDPTYPMPVFLVDIRPASQRAREGGIHGSLIIERNVLEWRFDPRCEARLAIADRYDLKIIIYCQEGYTSSLAAASLHELGLLNATDIVGGFAAWGAAGLPGQIRPPSTISDEESYQISQPSFDSDDVIDGV